MSASSAVKISQQNHQQGVAVFPALYIGVEDKCDVKKVLST
jgi:hypothetical protein